MTSNSLALTSSGNWRNRDENHETSSSNWDHHQRRQPSFPWPIYYQQEEGYLPWRQFEERVRTGPFGLARFPSQPYSPARILIIDSGIDGERVNPRLRQFIHESPPRIRREWQLSFTPDAEAAPALTDAEYKAAMKRLRKQTYEPPQSKKKPWKSGLFSNRNKSSNYGQEGNGNGKEEDKKCAICLESFVPREQVLLTPCGHMFHNDCIVPWVKSHGQCPVCRFKLCERKETVRAPDSSVYINTAGNIYADGDDLALDLLALVRAMEEAFTWIHRAH